MAFSYIYTRSIPIIANAYSDVKNVQWTGPIQSPDNKDIVTILSKIALFLLLKTSMTRSLSLMLAISLPMSNHFSVQDIYCDFKAQRGIQLLIPYR